MVFTEIQAVQFRNLSTEAVPVDKRQVFLIGTNGQGKTNFLEAIYTLCYGSSFRSSQLRELVSHGEKAFKLTGKYLGEDSLTHTLVLEYQDAKRKVFLDEREIKDRKELIYNIPCIVFSHDDIAFVRGEPEQRRRFFDQTMSMYDPLFFDDMRRYRLLLKQRNLAIKEGRHTLLPVYDLQMAKYGLAIQKERKKAVAEFDQIFPEMYRNVSNSDSNIEIKYQSSWAGCTTEDDIVEYLAKTRNRDFTMMTTTSGIHRDRFTIVQDDGTFSQIGSTGQLRLASLILRTAQMAFFHKKTGKRPLILVDDVLLELDLAKREKFLSLMEGYSQAFFTFLPEEHYFASLASEDALVYDVRQGSFLGHEG
jgi:DNA replication and repair protein RecF